MLRVNLCLIRRGLPNQETNMTEFDFDVITGPSGPIRFGGGACGWVSADAPAPPPTSPLSAPPEREQHHPSELLPNQPAVPA
jgi:hypothetical protein